MMGDEEDPLDYIIQNLGKSLPDTDYKESKSGYEEYSGYKYNMSNQLLFRDPPPSLLSDHDLDDL